MMKILKILIWPVLLVVIILATLIVTATLTDYNPEEVSVIEVNSSKASVDPDKNIDLMIWNIGYCGLDASMDFFYDGGQQVRTSRENVQENLNAVQELLMENDSIEIFLLQEVDIDSKRSYGMNQYDSISGSLSGYYNYMARNYDVMFVPLPPTNPMGRVKSGLLTLSSFQPSSVRRYSFPGNYAWPKSLFMLDRCFMVNRYPLSSDKELLVINTHNSAYDDGRLKQKQMAYLEDFLTEEYNKGNFIIVGGDWNQSPPGFSKNFKDQFFDSESYSELEKDYPTTGWKWVYDETIPTNRRVRQVYQRGSTPTALIDFYLISPNIKALDVKTLDLNFQHSDHQPVIMKASLKVK